MSIFVSLLTAGTNNHEETSENANAMATDFVSEGVVDSGGITNTSGVAPSTGAFAVNAQSTPNMTVAVTSGVAYVAGAPTGQDSQTLRVRMTASTNVTISSNTSGVTKYDWLYIKLDADKMANPGVNADDVATLVTSRSSSSSSDDGTPPTYGYCIGVITVADSASSIANANITDSRVLARSVQNKSVTADTLADSIELPASNPLMLFLNRSWQSPTRAAGTTYTNSNTYPIDVVVVVSRTTKFSAIAQLSVGSTVVDKVVVNDSDNGTVNVSLKATVPPGATYNVAITLGSVVQWRELS